MIGDKPIPDDKDTEFQEFAGAVGQEIADGLNKAVKKENSKKSKKN